MGKAIARFGSISGAIALITFYAYLVLGTWIDPSILPRYRPRSLTRRIKCVAASGVVAALGCWRYLVNGVEDNN